MSENEVKSAGADLRAMLMVGNNNQGNNNPKRGGNRGRKKNQSRISYDKDALLAIGKNAASQKRPEFLDPEYDAKPSQQALALGANPHPRWDPEKWHSNTKPKRSNPAQSASPLTLLQQASGQQQQQQQQQQAAKVEANKENGDNGWRKEEQDQPEQRLGPQRRSFAGGCKPAQRSSATNEAEIILGPKRGGNSGQQEKETRAWRPSRVRDNNQDDDKFKDFRSEKPGHQRYSAAERFGNNRDGGGGRGRRNFGRNYHDEEEEEVPEWMTEGPDTVNDVLNLDECVLPERRHQHQQQQKQVQEQRSDSPELVAFDFATGGVVANDDDALGGGLEDDQGGLGQPQGLVDFHSKELDELLEQIDSDDGADAGVSRFSSFFNKPQAPNPMTMDTLSNPRSGLGLRVQQQQQQQQERQQPTQQQRPMVDPSVWQQQQLPVVPPPQQQQRMAPPPQLVQDPAVLDMRSLQERTFAATGPPPPNLMKMNPLMAQMQQQQPRMAQPPPPPPTGQVMSLEELERGVTAIPENANAPAPEVKAMLLNLTRQKSDFEQKNNMQRMMLLQQPNKQQQQQQPPTIVPPPPVTVPPLATQPSQYPPQLAPRTPNSFGLNEPLGGGARAINGLVGLPPMQQQQAPPPQPPPQQQQRQQHNSAERERIYAYLMGEKRQRNLTPSEERFLEKNAPPPPPQQATAELMSQMALHDEIQKQMAMMDPRNSQRQQQQQQPPPPQMVNGLGARELEAHQQRQAEAQRRQQQQQQQQQHYQDHQKGISLERQKAQFDQRFEKSNGDKGGGGGSVSSFTTHFTPTSVMRKMVRKTGDDDGRGQRKITPLEHTGVVRVPKGASEMRSKQKQQQQVQQQQQQAPNRNLLSQFPPLSSINQGQPPHRQGNGAANVPPFMLQQLMFQGQQQQQQTRPPPPPMGGANIATNPADVFRQQQQAAAAQPPQPPRGFEQEQGNIHIEKLLNQQNYDF